MKEKRYLRELIKEFISAFKEMPNRASGNYLEQKSSGIISHFTEALFSCKTVFQPFAIDYSSGSWNVALHSIFFLVFSAGGVFIGKLFYRFTAVGFVWQTVNFGFFGQVPVFFLLLSFIFCLLILLSRISASFSGWSLFSFFIPNAESGNIICASRKEKEGPKKKLIIFSAHYDTARCLPPSGKNKFLYTVVSRLAKNGLSVAPTLAAIVICLLFFLHVFFSLSEGLSFWLIILGLIALIIVIIEGAVSSQSSDLPFNPGFNDNLSGVSVLIGLMGLLFPKVPGRSRYVSDELQKALGDIADKGPKQADTDYLFVFTGSEENGLRGVVHFRQNYLDKYIKDYLKNNIYTINLDSVSGKYIKMFNKEKDFAGLTRGGNEKFIDLCDRTFKEKTFEKNYLLGFFTEEEIAAYFEKDKNGRDKYTCILPKCNEAIQACTDMSGLCSVFDKKQNIITIVSRETDKEEAMSMPRDYHSLEDSYEKMALYNNGQYLGPVYFLVFALYNLAGELENL